MLAYKATNCANGKIYIGITMQAFDKRKTQHKSRAGKCSTAFSHALAKYGMEGFTWEILGTYESAAELNAAEVSFIKQFNSLADGGHGYNRTNGGAGSAGLLVKQHTREKQSKNSLRHWRRRFLARPRNEQLTLAMGRCNYRHSEETKAKIGLSGKGQRRNLKIHDSSLPLIRSMHAAGFSQSVIAGKFGVNRATISYVIKRNNLGAAW